MFGLGFTKDDLKRVVWTFIQAGFGALVVALAAQSKLPADWNGTKQFAWGLLLAFAAAGFSAVKNLVLADGSAVK